ncbi:MAG: ClbS/DfsB family four-helix bundle protein [Candidatus Dojkabacteria bacterium]
MVRAKNKEELLQSSQQNYEQLLNLIESVPQHNTAQPGVCEAWSVKDILAHLSSWHKMTLKWHESGMSGLNPRFLPEGYTWKTTPELNDKLYREHKDDIFEDVLAGLKESHQSVTAVIERHSNEELFTKKLYSWTGSSSLGAYLISATSSHYDWAYKLINKWSKAGFKSALASSFDNN